MIRYYKKTRGSIPSLDGKRKIELLWGDWLDVEETTPPSNDYIVNWLHWSAKTDRAWRTQYRIKKAHCQKTPLVEMIFLDVGQGDGCIVSLPDGDAHRILVVDAGQHGHMRNFLRWKTRGFRVGTHIHAAIVTHPDQDHYLGFQPLFSEPRLRFDHVYHNGLAERTAATRDDEIGPREDGYCTDIVATHEAMHALMSSSARRGRKQYPRLMWTALSNPARFGRVEMLSTLTGEMEGGRAWLPGFAPATGPGPRVEILGPVPEPDAAGRLRLRAFPDPKRNKPFDFGKTKNGHSVILRLEYGGFTAIFGGDLNRPAEDYLLRHYGGVEAAAPLADTLPEARKRLSADLLKCCHHGSADVTDEFVAAVHPFVAVISSGDRESHVHPRPEILGMLGKQARGARPLLLSTELQRSGAEKFVLGDKDIAALDALMLAYADAAAGDRARARQKIDAFWAERLNRLVSVYGAINIRTDGKKLIAAFKKESGGGWQVYEFGKKEDGDWTGAELGGH